MGEKEQRSRSTEITVAIIGLIGALGGGVLANWEKIFSSGNSPSSLHATQATVTSSASQHVNDKKAEEAGNHMAWSLPGRQDWARTYFKPCAAGTWNVIVKSLGNDQYEALSALRDLAGRFPNVAFKVVRTIARDQVSNGRFAIFVGHGLSRTEAKTLVAHVKTQGIAADAYAVCQEWSSPCSVPDEWQVVR